MSDNQAPIEGERHVSVVSQRSVMSRRTGMVVIGGLAAAAVTYIFLEPYLKAPRAQAATSTPLQVGRVVTNSTLPLPPTPAAYAEPRPQLNPSVQSTQAAPDLLQHARHASLLVNINGGAAEPQAGPDGSPAPSPPGSGTELGQRLQPTETTAVSASRLQHRPYLITMGESIPCVLETAINSTLPGMVVCHVDRNIKGRTGITLIDRYAKMVGEYKSDMGQGQYRLFILWKRVENPDGVIINLDSPGTDALGRAGVGGVVNTHFLDRIGVAAALTVLQGAMSIGTAAVAPVGGAYLNLNTGDTQSAVSDALRGNQSIKPSLDKKPGDLVAVMVARDLDFSTAYSLKLAGRTGVVNVGE